MSPLVVYSNVYFNAPVPNMGITVYKFISDIFKDLYFRKYGDFLLFLNWIFWLAYYLIVTINTLSK